MTSRKTVELCLGGPYDGQRLLIPADVFCLQYPRDSASHWSYVDVGTVEGNGTLAYSADGRSQLFMYVGVVVYGPVAAGKKGRGR